MRTSNSIKNIIWSFIFVGIGIVASFISQIFFVNYLGAEYLGINGLIGNLVSALGLVELGFGSAITYFLYKPVASNDIEVIKIYLKYFSSTYKKIAGIILLFGLILLPFIGFIVGDISSDINIHLIFFLFVIDSVFSYLLVYKRVILVVNQKNYIVNIFRTIYIILLHLIQILVLIYTSNYILYLVVKLIMKLFENFVISYVAGKKYSYIKDKSLKKINDKDKKLVKEKVNGMSFHKLSGFIITNTDNLLISNFFGIVMVGYYYNYLLILNALVVLFSQVYISLTPIVGNYLVSEKKDNHFNIYKKFEFLNYFIIVIVCNLLLCLLQPFISIWLGSEYLISSGLVIVIVLNFYFNLIRRGQNVFKEAEGIFVEDKYIALIEAICNLVLSLICIKLFGLIGVFIGTTVSNFIIFLYSYPKYVYNKMFNRSGFEYIFNFFKKLILCLIIIISSYLIINIISGGLLVLIFKAVLVIILTVLWLVIIYGRSEEFKFLLSLIKKVKK